MRRPFAVVLIVGVLAATAEATEIREPTPMQTVSGSIHAASAPSNVPWPEMLFTIGIPRSASRRATFRSSPARTVEAGRAKMMPSGVGNSRSAQNIWFGGGGTDGETP